MLNWYYNKLLHALDKEIKELLDMTWETMNERLEELVQSNVNCCNATTGSFHNPAHNCSHIAHEHPDATSGRKNNVWYMLSVEMSLPVMTLSYM